MTMRRCLGTLTLRAISFLSSSSGRTVPNSFTHNPTINVSYFTPAGPHFHSSFHFLRQFSGSSEDSGKIHNGEGGTGSDAEAEKEALSTDSEKFTVEEKEAEAASIGYKVLGPLQPADRAFKPYEPVFAVVQIGSHQFKVSNGDSIFVERLKFCEVNDKIVLNKVLLLGSKAQTIVGRPTIPDAAVHSVVEEHAMDAKVIIFKKKRRKNYRRTKGHRQELTQLRITDIQGIARPETPIPAKSKRKVVVVEEKIPVAA